MNPADRQEWIDARHADGVVRATSRHDFRNEVLPAVFKEGRAAPDRLAEAILTALELGLAAEAVAVADHLARIDADRRRRTWLPALVLSRVGRVQKAGELLVRGRDLFGDCTDFRYVEAEISFARHLRTRGEEALAVALDDDPNHSRSLRLEMEHSLLVGGEPARRSALERLASREGAWRARLLLSSLRFAQGDMTEAHRLAVDAAAMEPRDAILGPLSSLLAKQHDCDGLLELVWPKFEVEKHGARCGVNVLFSLLDARRSAEGSGLVDAIRAVRPSGLDDHLKFYADAFAALDSGSDEGGGAVSSLQRALATCARHDTVAHRRTLAAKLLGTRMLLPLNDPVADVRILDLGLPEPLEAALEAVTAIDSNGRRVTLAFTDEKALAAWDARHRHRVALVGDALLSLVRSAGSAALVVNGGGPASLELSAAQIAALLDTGELTEAMEHAAFLVEPLRTELPEPFFQAVAKLVRDEAAIRDAFLFESVSERTGARPAVALEFADGVDARTKRDLIVDAGESLVLKRGRKRFPLPIVEVGRGPLLECLRSLALRVRR